MRRVRLVGALIVLVLVVAAVWLAGAGPQQSGESADARQATAAAYDFEAQGVVVRQMDASGRLQYQIEAEGINQLPDSGRIAATHLTMLHDPPGTTPGGRHRWTLTAEGAELPPQGGVVSLHGKVRASGRPVNGNTQATLATERLQYDLDALRVSSDTDLALTWGGTTLNGPRGGRVDIKTGDWALNSRVHVRIQP